MECNVTSTKPRRRAAFTIMEMLVAMSISGLVVATLMQFIFFTGRSFAALANYTELDRYSRNALDQMVHKIRQADQMTDFSSNRMVFAYNTTNTLTYDYSPTAKILTETIGGGQPRILLSGCDVLTFSVFQRNTASGTYDQFPATLTNNAVKLVQLSWTCSRTVLGSRINTESVQSAKIVIRNPQ